MIEIILYQSRTFSIQNWNVIRSQSGLGLDTNQQWRASSSGHAFSWEMLGLECQSKSSLHLLNHELDELSETVCWVLSPQVMNQLRDHLSISLGLKHVATLLQELFDVLKWSIVSLEKAPVSGLWMLARNKNVFYGQWQ